MMTLTLEDILAAARCVALWQRTGAQPLRIARHIRSAAERAERFRLAQRRVHPLLGDGSVAAAAAALAPSETPCGTAPEGIGALLPALNAVSVALMQAEPPAPGPGRP